MEGVGNLEIISEGKQKCKTESRSLPLRSYQCMIIRTAKRLKGLWEIPWGGGSCLGQIVQGQGFCIFAIIVIILMTT